MSKENFHQNDEIAPLLPERGWLADYMKFTGSLQACERFKFFSAISVMGAAIGNRVWIQRGDKGLLPKMFPNPWVVLLGPPGQGNKSQSLNMAVNLLAEASPSTR